MNRWSSEIDAITGRFLNAFSILSEEEINWKPAPEAWSIAENIEHVIILNESYFPAFERLKRGNFQLPFIARFDFVVRFFGRMILKSVQPENAKKMKTFPIWEPPHSNFEKSILHRFEKHQARLKQELDDLKDKIKENAVISSPANNNLVYKLETLFDILVTHEKRHFKQANEVYEQLKKNTN